MARRSYPLSATRITGYGVPNYSNLNSSRSDSTKKKTNKEELAYLKKVLEKKKSTTSTKVDGTVTETGKLPDCNVQVIVTNSKKSFEISVKDGMKLIWERKGMPGKLTFEAKYDGNFKITEGSSVLLIVDGTKMFYGFVFQHKKTKEGWYSYTVYDQLRYLKNKDTLIYKKKRADQVIKIIAERLNLQCGKLANTAYKMSAIEEDSTLFDMIQNALDNTLMTKNKVYVFV